MTVACASCGTEPREGARFCDACGSAITASTQPPEYKQVTVLFADVVRSMEMASKLGTERLREVMSELLSRSRTVVTRYGGTVDFTGDGIMALFGAPIALEDHAFRGCLAALELQEQACAFADELRRRDDIQLQLRVGLNSGRGDRGRDGFHSRQLHGDRCPRRNGAADGGGHTAGRGNAECVDRAPRRRCRRDERTRNGADQERRRTGARLGACCPSQRRDPGIEVSRPW